MIRPLPPACLVLALLLLSGCDTRGLTVLAEIDDTFGFESGLGPWSAVTSVSEDGTASATVTTEQAASGSSSVRLDLDDPGGQAGVVIRRAFEVEPSQAYDVEVAFAFGTSDGPGVSAWTIRLAATPTPPGVVGLPAAGSTATSGDGFVFEDRALDLTSSASAEGELWVTLGVTQDAPGARSYYLDDVTVVLTRRNP